MRARAYLDWNATAPLRPEARAAMIAAMDALGNPSSVHAEGRAARAIVERARRQIADAAGASGADIVFTSGATEAAGLALAGRGGICAAIEHDCVRARCDQSASVAPDGAVSGADVLQTANSETGIVQTLPEGLLFTDAVQSFGKQPFAFAWSGAQMAALSAHKIGGPKGVGALLLAQGTELPARELGGGQEMGRRAGTENVIGIAAFGAAAEAAARDLADGRWQAVRELRDEAEGEIADLVPEAVIAGCGAVRLPNTSCIIVPGWKGETQVMQMDLAGFAISAGSACSSGKVRRSTVLMAMGHDEVAAASAIRVSIGPDTLRDDVLNFVRVWAEHYRRWRIRAA